MLSGVEGIGKELQRYRQSNDLERSTIDGDSPVDENVCPPLLPVFQSSTDPVEFRVKLGGPPSKAKYFSATDSEK